MEIGLAKLMEANGFAYWGTDELSPGRTNDELHLASSSSLVDSGARDGPHARAR